MDMVDTISGHKKHIPLPSFLKPFDLCLWLQDSFVVAWK